jgi:hypothetical protein
LIVKPFVFDHCFEFQDPSLINSQTAAAAAAMLSLPPTLPFHPLIPVSLPMIDPGRRHLLMPNNSAHPWCNNPSSQILLQQLSSVAAAATRNHQLFSTSDCDSWRTPFVLDPSMSTVDPQTASAAAAAAMFYPIELGDSRMFGHINLPANTITNNSNNNNNNNALRQAHNNSFTNNSNNNAMAMNNGGLNYLNSNQNLNSLNRSVGLEI